jgi:signal transduction histidine kinase/DNA-binding response OmpR family regulator/HAMP domain-containing protein
VTESTTADATEELDSDALLEVLTAFRAGDFTARLPATWTGKSGKIADTLNTVIRANQRATEELVRIGQLVGKEGRIAERLSATGWRGGWDRAVRAIDDMIEDLIRPNDEIASVIGAVARGDLTQSVPMEVDGRPLKGVFAGTARTVNTMVGQLNSFAAEVTRVAREVGTEGRLGGQAHVSGVSGVWKDLTDNANEMAANLTAQVRNIAEVTTAVANGDLSRKITVEGEGEILELKSTINVMVDRLNAFASEVTRVAREVGTEGKLGGQAHVPGAAGIWDDLTDNVNLLAAQLTQQIRNIAEVTTAVANGDLSKKVTVDVQGEILELKSTINVMVDQLNDFASEVTRVAREVGTEGKLGGQAQVPGVAGIWKALAVNVNQLADTLTEQIRAIAEVATAVTEGDLTRSIGVDASGEVAVLKDTLNEMIRNLRETTGRNTAQDWLKTHLARFNRMLQGQRDLNTVSSLILSELARLVSAQHGIFYTVDLSRPEEPLLRRQAGYASRRDADAVFRLGEGLVGQCAVEKRPIMLDDVPSGYIAISSGLGEAPPLSIIVLPVLFEGQVRAVIELASFQRFSPLHLDFLGQLTDSIGVVINTIEANSRTEELLAQSQSLAGELQTQQEELRQTNDELEGKARLLAEQNSEVESKNLEVELARRSLEDKAEQLAETSRYKSEFLANMSHELRTPLNSMLILAEQLSDNPGGNLSPRQTEFAKIIWSSGQDLLALINDILDLSKIESGTVSLEIREESCDALRDVLDRSFCHVAERKQLDFSIGLEPGLPPLRTDSKRLQQVLKNLLSNAFKFTEKGRVRMVVRTASDGWDPQVRTLEDAAQVVAFEVADTGIGIPADKQEVIFDAFKQADGTTSRKFGGTGLGLSISRELVRLLGGQITVESEAGAGSRFTVYLPVEAPRQLDELVPGIAAAPRLAAARGQAPDVEDDRRSVGPGDAAVLIVEDDTNFARVLLDLARRNGFKAVVARDGRDAIELARALRPAAVTLDIGLRDISGWKVLEALREDPGTERTPVHVVSVFEDARQRVTVGGASSFHSKPVSRRTLERLFRTLSRPGQRGPRLLMVGGELAQRQDVGEAAARVGIELLAAEDADQARRLLQREHVDCLLLDMRLPSSAELLQRLHRSRRLKALPVVTLAGASAGGRPDPALSQLAGQVAVVATLPAEELIEEVERVLGHGERKHETDDARGGEGSRGPGPAPVDAAPPDENVIGLLAGHRALVVDDDVRNVFALTALLERYGMQVQTAESGDEAVGSLRGDPAIEVVLMDVMMPGKDGYTTMREVRAIPGFGDMPIIAVTAKAMKGDRERCLEAGATDYVAKPVEPEKLVAMLVEALEIS